MKHFLSLALTLIFGAASAQAQQLMPATVTVQASIKQPEPYVLVGTEATTMHALVLNPDLIESVDVYKGAQATEKYGQQAKDGAVVITLKGQLPLARLEQVYNAFNVPEQQRSLKVAVDNKLVSNPELLLAHLPDIAKIEVKQQDVTATARFSFDPDAPYLNIVTKQL